MPPRVLVPSVPCTAQTRLAGLPGSNARSLPSQVNCAIGETLILVKVTEAEAAFVDLNTPGLGMNAGKPPPTPLDPNFVDTQIVLGSVADTTSWLMARPDKRLLPTPSVLNGPATAGLVSALSIRY